jgi:hypothetical protein
MGTRAAGWGAVLGWLPLLLCAAPKPEDWVPARWPWAEAASLELLDGTPVNCLLVRSSSAALARQAAARGVVTLAVVAPSADAVAEACAAAAAGMAGVVLDGDFPEGTAARVREAAADAVVVELGTRARMPLGRATGIIGTFQGVWPGIQIQAGGAVKAAPTGSPWIETNTGFIRAARAWGGATIWLGNLPPAASVIPSERYVQAIADAAMSGARWVLAFDSGLAARLARRDAAAMKTWSRMAQALIFYESHAEWRAMRPHGKLAVVQDAASGGLLSGGILDMLATRHTPVRPVPGERLTAAALEGASIAVNVEGNGLRPEQREILRAFAGAGNMLLTAPPGDKAPASAPESITLDKGEQARLNDLWRDVQSVVGRRNMGVRLFNVSSMLSNLVASAGGKQVVVHLVNYSAYPVENVAVHFLGKFTRATLLAPGSADRKLEIYETEDGGGVDLAQVGVCAAVRLE